MGFIPKLCLLKIKHSPEYKKRVDVKTDDNGGMSDNSKKDMNSINLMQQYKELGLTTREVVLFLGRQAEVDCNHVREDFVE